MPRPTPPKKTQYNVPSSSSKRSTQGQSKRHPASLRLGDIWAWLNSPDCFEVVSVCLLFVEALLNIGIIFKVPYTEIDWSTYMQQIDLVRKGIFDYAQIGGDTGPIVYPGGFVWLYYILSLITDHGTQLRLAQFIFGALNVAFLGVVLAIYRKTAIVPPWALVTLILSKRIHSIFVLRLFNDCWSMFFLYVAVLLFVYKKWTWGCFFFSAATSIKMNILNFAPSLLLLLLKSFGVWKTIPRLAVCGFVQLLVALPFLRANWWGYLMNSFNFGRKFFYIWTVNLKFLSEETFLSNRLAISLLFFHLGLLACFVLFFWTREENGITNVLRAKRSPNGQNSYVTPSHIATVLFVGNFLGVLCARSLHYQFYVWYFHSLPLILWLTDLNVILRLGLMFTIELCWNVYPSTSVSSLTLLLCHLMILVGLLRAQLTKALKIS